MPHAWIHFVRTPRESAWITTVRGSTMTRTERADTFADAKAVCWKLWRRAAAEDQQAFELLHMAFHGIVPDSEQN